MQPDNGDRDYMYGLMISQLSYDGHQQLALNLASSIGCSANPPVPCDKLFRLISAAKQFNEAINPDGTRMPVVTRAQKRKRKPEPTKIQNFPLELVEKIAHHLDVKDVLELMKVNKRFYSSYTTDRSIIFGKHVAEVSLGYSSYQIKKFVDSPSFELDATLFPFIKQIDSCDKLDISFYAEWTDGMFLGQLKSVNRLEFRADTKEGWLKFLTHFCGSVKKHARLDFKIGLLEQDLVMKEQLGQFIKNQLNGCEKITLGCNIKDCFHIYHEAMMKTQSKWISINTNQEFEKIVGRIVNQGIPSKNPEAVIHIDTYLDDDDEDDEGNGIDIDGQVDGILQGVLGLQPVTGKNHAALVSRANKLLRENGEEGVEEINFFDKNVSCFRRRIDPTKSKSIYVIYDAEGVRFLVFYMPSL